MTPNSLLSIAIPTYNRSDILQENLLAMLPDLMEHRVAVYISDDSQDERTREMVDDLSTIFPLLVYRKNEPGLGHDANFFSTLAMPNTDYVWYLGDSQYFIVGTLGALLKMLTKTRPDLCFLNSNLPERGSRVIEGEAVHPFLLDRTWYLTLSGATIYGRLPRMLRISQTVLANWTNFPQLGLILECCSRAPRCLLWIGTPTLRFNKKKTSYWVNSTFSVFVKDWSKLIRSFNVLFSKDEQDQIIRSHGKHTHLFSLLNLIRLRALGILTKDVLEQHASDFEVASPISPVWARLLSFLPRRAVAAVWSLKRSQ
jgi:abequosyltransferase